MLTHQAASGGTLLSLTTLMYKEGRLLIVCSRIINLESALTAQGRTPLPSSYIHLNLDDFSHHTKFITKIDKLFLENTTYYN